MKFKELTIGQTFEFDRGNNSLALLSFPNGPWVKISARRYHKSIDPFSYIEQVGSVNVKVRVL